MVEEKTRFFSRKNVWITERFFDNHYKAVQIPQEADYRVMIAEYQHQPVKQRRCSFELAFLEILRETEY